MMKTFALGTLALVTFVSTALAESIVAPGKVVYKMPDGELVRRDVSLEVPSRGEDDLILRAGEFEVKAHAFKSHEQNGRILFCAVFLDPPGAPANTVALYKGTYLRGTNLALYYGDVFAGTYSDTEKARKALEGVKLDSINIEGEHPDLNFAAGFMFSAPIEK